MSRDKKRQQSKASITDLGIKTAFYTTDDALTPTDQPNRVSRAHQFFKVTSLVQLFLIVGILNHP